MLPSLDNYHGWCVRWFFPCNSWLGKDAGWSTLLPTQLTDPRNGASHVDYQVSCHLSICLTMQRCARFDYH